MKVLATGATGRYAHHVVSALVAQGIDARGVVHDPAKADEARRAGATETVEADLADTGAIAEALDGVDGVFLITPAFHPDATMMALNVVNAAADASIGKFVYNGVYHLSLSLPNHAGTRPVEEALYASDLDFTVLQPAMYVQALAATYRDALGTGAVTAPWSKHSKMTYVDYRGRGRRRRAGIHRSAPVPRDLLAGRGRYGRPHRNRRDDEPRRGTLTGRRERRRRPCRARRPGHDVRRLRPRRFSRRQFSCPAGHSAAPAPLGRRFHRRARPLTGRHQVRARPLVGRQWRDGPIKFAVMSGK